MSRRNPDGASARDKSRKRSRIADSKYKVKTHNRALVRSTMERRIAENLRTGGYLGIERKFYDTFLGFTAVPSPVGALTGGEMDPATKDCLNAIVQGAGPNQRIGRQCTLKSCYVQGILSSVATNTAEHAPIVTVFLVLDRQTNGSQLASEQVFTNPSSEASVSPFPFHDLENVKRFRVLDKVTVTLTDYSIAYNSTSMVYHQAGGNAPFSLKWSGDLVVNYDDPTTENVSSISDNSLHVIAFASNTASSVSIAYNARIRFYG